MNSRDYVRILENVQIYKSFDSGVEFKKIKSIKTLEAQHVYDLSIEGTRNFIANGIIAHNTAVLPYVNTSGLVLLMHFNNESAFGENTTGLDNMSYDFSPDVSAERSGSVRNNGTFYGGATINKTDKKFGGGAVEFYGKSEFVSVTSSGMKTSNGTVMLWAKPLGPTGGVAPIYMFSHKTGSDNNRIYLI